MSRLTKVPNNEVNPVVLTSLEGLQISRAHLVWGETERTLALQCSQKNMSHTIKLQMPHQNGEQPDSPNEEQATDNSVLIRVMMKIMLANTHWTPLG